MTRRNLPRSRNACPTKLVWLLFATFCGCSDRSSPPQTPSGQLPPYRIVFDQLQDNLLETQIWLRVIVSQPVTDDALRLLMTQLFEDAMLRSGFIYHESPTSVYVYVYDNEAGIESGKWLGMLSLDAANHESGQPTIDLDNPARE